jgi:hypothetical protein
MASSVVAANIVYYSERVLSSGETAAPLLLQSQTTALSFVTFHAMWIAYICSDTGVPHKSTQGNV